MPQYQWRKGVAPCVLRLVIAAQKLGGNETISKGRSGHVRDCYDVAVTQIVAGEDQYCTHCPKNTYVAQCEEAGNLLQRQELWSMVQSGM